MRHSFIRRRLSSVVFLMIGTKVVLAEAIVANTSSGVMIRLQTARTMSSVEGLGSICKLSMYLEEHQFSGKFYMLKS